MSKRNSDWCVYIVKCIDASLYTGITNNLERRIKEHNSGTIKAAKYTRFRSPVQLVYYKRCKNRSEASSLEMKIKKMPKQQKLSLISSEMEFHNA